MTMHAPIQAENLDRIVAETLRVCDASELKLEGIITAVGSPMYAGMNKPGHQHYRFTSPDLLMRLYRALPAVLEAAPQDVSGDLSGDQPELDENARVYLDLIGAVMPRDFERRFVMRAFLSSTMGHTWDHRLYRGQSGHTRAFQALLIAILRTCNADMSSPI